MCLDKLEYMIIKEENQGNKMEDVTSVTEFMWHRVTLQHSWMQSMKTLTNGQHCGMNINSRSRVDIGGVPERSFSPACCKMNHVVYRQTLLTNLPPNREDPWVTWHLGILFSSDLKSFLELMLRSQDAHWVAVNLRSWMFGCRCEWT